MLFWSSIRKTFLRHDNEKCFRPYRGVRIDWMNGANRGGGYRSGMYFLLCLFLCFCCWRLSVFIGCAGLVEIIHFFQATIIYFDDE